MVNILKLKYCVAVLVFVFTVSYFSLAQADDSDQDSQIAGLLEQIAVLENQLAILQGQSESLSPGFTFNNNLGIGDCNLDVLELQKVLNSDPATMVAEVGSGSPGNETQCFGSLTRSAVVRFQHRYADEILAPAGLTSATGFVGPSTRAKLNAILAEEQDFELSPTPAPEPVPEEEKTALPPPSPLDLETVDLGNFQTQDSFYIQEMGAPMASPGESVSVAGSGFSADTRAVIGDYLLPIESVTVSLGEGEDQNGQDFSESLGGLGGFAFAFNPKDSITINIPSNFPPGIYNLELVKGQFRASPSSGIIVRNPGASAPVIDQITQTGNSIRIHGSNLTDSNIVTVSGFGRVSNRPARDGVVTISKSRLVGSHSSINRTVQISVMNENGFSQPVSQTITFN